MLSVFVSHRNLQLGISEREISQGLRYHVHVIPRFLQLKDAIAFACADFTTDGVCPATTKTKRAAIIAVERHGPVGEEVVSNDVEKNSQMGSYFTSSKMSDKFVLVLVLVFSVLVSDLQSSIGLICVWHL